MTRNRALWIVVPLAMALPLACDKSNDNAGGSVATASAAVVVASAPTVVTPPASASAAPVAKPEHKRRPGLSGMLFHEASSLTLKDEQKASIEKLEAPMAPDDGGARNDFKEVHDELVAEVKAGKIETAKLDPLYAAVDKSIQARQDKEADALKGLHDLLDPAQRKALTAAVRARQAEREAKEAKHEADPAKPADGDWAKRRLDRMTKELDLDAAQQTKVQALIAKGEQPTPATMEKHEQEAKKRTETLLTAFEQETFDPKKVDLSPMPGKKPHEMMDQHVKFLTQLLPILKPEQREKLAAQMAKPRGPGMGGPGMGGPGMGGPGMGRSQHGGDPGYGMLFHDD